MIIGAYYRCPIVLDDEDKDHPRLFALGQRIEYNELADAGRVMFHDLLGSKAYYTDIVANNVFSTPILTRCEAMPGGTVEGSWGQGTIISRIRAGDESLPYWYNIQLRNGKYVTASETELKIEYSQMNFPPEKQLLGTQRRDRAPADRTSAVQGTPMTRDESVFRRRADRSFCREAGSS